MPALRATTCGCPYLFYPSPFIMSIHERYIKRALALADKARGETSPNPMVGALLVKGGRVITEGYHKKPGTPHAEAVALSLAGSKAKGATLYVNLEPCCHTDKKTLPCTDAIIQAGVKRVVAAMTDPNPKVSGRGFRKLRAAGIEVISGILRQEARDLNRVFIRFITTGLPYVTLKVAQSLDGKIATAGGQSKWITGPVSRRIVHRLRSENQAVMVGAGTVKADDPSLTARIRSGRNPIRIIVDGKLEISPDSKVLTDGLAPTWIATVMPPGNPTASSAMQKGVEILHIRGENGKLDMKELMREIGSRGITSMLIEGGSGINAAALRAGVVNRVMFFIAPKIIRGRNAIPSVGGPGIDVLEKTARLGAMSVTQSGRDILIDAEFLG